MVELLAKQSVDRKMEIQSSVITGNYEMYYAAGLLSAQIQVDINEQTYPLELKEKVMAALDDFQPADAKQEYLKTLLHRYVPTEDYDEQMADLFLWGKTGREPAK